MEGQMITLLFIALPLLSMAQQLPCNSNLNREYCLVIPACQNLPTSCPNANPCNDESGTQIHQSATIRDDYTYTVGVGAHKVHARPTAWHEARRICETEGGYLAIINSVAESNIILNHLQRVVPNFDWALIGFHDLFVSGEYLTVHSESLSKAGFTQWYSGEPTHPRWGQEHCGCVSISGELADIACEYRKPFVCELPVQ